MKNQIKEVQNWFKTELLKGNFDIEQINENSIEIITNGYKFRLGTLSDIVFQQSTDNFMDLELSDQEQRELYPILRQKTSHLILEEKQAKLAEMAKEIEQLKTETK